MIQKLTGPIDVTLGVGILSYAVAYLGLKVLVEVYGFANPVLARQRHEAAENKELADNIARPWLNAQVRNVEEASA